jgi:hypothetical protein
VSVFGRVGLWAAIAVFTFVIAVGLVTAGHFVLAAALVALVVIGAIYSQGGTRSL